MCIRRNGNFRVKENYLADDDDDTNEIHAGWMSTRLLWCVSGRGARGPEVEGA